MMDDTNPVDPNTTPEPIGEPETPIEPTPGSPEEAPAAPDAPDAPDTTEEETPLV